MKLLCITEPETHPEFDTTVELYNRFAEDPRINLFHASTASVCSGGRFCAVPIPSPLEYQSFLGLNGKAFESMTFGEFDLVFCRSDKPLPENYYKYLSTFEDRVKFVNSPSGLEKVSESYLVENLCREFLPAHIYSRKLEEVRQFFERHKRIVCKLPRSYGGKGVYKIWEAAAGVFKTDNIISGTKVFDSLDTTISGLLALDSGNFQFVEFLSNISQGDKRVLVVDGEIYGGYIRKSSSDHWVHNVTAGARSSPSEVGEHERKIVEATCSFYHELGISTLGYDFLVGNDGDWCLSEINAGNIGGYGRLETLSGEAIYQRLGDYLIRMGETSK